MLKGKTVLVGVTGGIAVYKAAEVVSRLVKLGANVRVVMTKSASEFVAPLTFQTLSKNPVVCDMFAPVREWRVEHIALADEADIALILPATANIIGKIASGIADDMLSTTVMAVKSPVIICPAMNTNMYENPVTLKNIDTLKKRGFLFVEPEEGMLACGVSGKGRLASPETIVEKVLDTVAFSHDLSGIRVLVTAGPTREYLDPVRYISNPASGKMGFAIAKAAKRRGASVTLVTGPVALPDIPDVYTVRVTSADEMHSKVMALYQDQDIIVKSAAVGDFRAKHPSDQKTKKAKDSFTLHLAPNPDILKELGEKASSKQVLVGFCMETEDLVKNAEDKLVNKNSDMIVANDLSKEGVGFAGDTNEVILLKKDGACVRLPMAKKEELAHDILNEAHNIYEQKNGLR